MRALAIGIMPWEQSKERVLAIVSGEYKPAPDEPKIWFGSKESLADVLNEDNRALLDLITRAQPKSILSLATLAGMEPRELLRTLKMLCHYHIVELTRESNLVRPIVKANKFRVVEYEFRNKKTASEGAVLLCAETD